MPKTVFSGTAIAVMISVSLNACTVFGSVSESQRCPAPWSNARQKTIESGAEQHDQQVAERRRSAATYLRTLVPRREEAERRRSRAGCAKEIMSITTATAAAPAWSPLWMWLKTKTDADLRLERQVAAR